MIRLLPQVRTLASRRPAWLVGRALACLCVLALTIPAARSAFGDGVEPLPVDEAFRATAEATALDTAVLQVRFEIAEGYYLYRDKLAFELRRRDGETLARPEADLPDGDVVEDEFFGRSVVYRGPTEITLPIDVDASWPDELQLAIDFQGCADLGLCYPPTTTLLDVSFAAAASGRPALDDAIERVAALPARLSTWLGGGDRADSSASRDVSLSGGVATDELLRPDEAFTLHPGAASADRIVLDWDIEPGYYLYRDKLDFRLIDSASRVVDVDMPAGALQHDEFFGETAVLRERVPTVLRVAPPLATDTVTLEVDWQGCADAGVCFPPSTSTLDVPVTNDGTVMATEVAASTGSGELARTTGASSDGFAASLSEQDRLSAQLGSAALWLNAATFFVLGLLLAFTPCVLPMVPILSSLIVGHDDAVGPGRAFRLSLVYVLAMATTYTIVGVLIGLSGFNIQAWFQNPWVLSIFAGIVVLLALAMFGLYELQVPTRVQQRLQAWSNGRESGRYGGVATMGFLSALIVGPCVTAPLVGALIYIAETGDAVVGGVALFSLSMGMGLPLLLIGTSAGHLLPKAGAWMDRVRVLFGLLLLAMAIYLLSRILSPGVTMGLSAMLAVVGGICLGATDRLDRDSGGAARFAKGVGLVVTIYGIALFVGVLAGGGSLMTPLRGLAAGGVGVAGEASTLDFARVKTVEDLERVVARATAADRPVMLDFYADWCISCKEMEAFTFSDPAVRAALENAVLVQADVTANDAADQALLQRFGLFGPPAIILFDANGDELRPARLVGYMDAERFTAHVTRFIGQG